MRQMHIKNTEHETSCPWPESAQGIQGGAHGLVLRSKSEGGNYGTAFVELYSPESGFIRGEGPTIPEAEKAAWGKYCTTTSCQKHEFESRGYKNGAGFCKHCNKFESDVFTPEQLGLYCKVCGAPTFWSRIGDDMYCKQHAEDPDTRWLKQQRLRETRGTDEVVTGSGLGDLLEWLIADQSSPDGTQEPQGADEGLGPAAIQQ